MTDYGLPALAAVLLWWAGTGLVLLLDRVPRPLAPWSFLLASLLTVGTVTCIGHTAASATVSAAYGGFVCAVMLWGWHELAFLGGWVTGPRQDAVSPGAQPFRRLSEALQVLLWHELALLGTTAVLWAWVGRSANPVAAWTFTVLYVMRASAKVNLFLGVRNLGLDFLPPRLAYLGSYFRHRRFNALMPWVLVLGAAVAGWWALQALSLSGGERTARVLLVSLLTLALVEHLLMVLPLQPSWLWRWAIKREAAVGS